ncbi:MAG: TrbC/VirB2 family protein [Beijerinckiaceae bacterium]
MKPTRTPLSFRLLATKSRPRTGLVVLLALSSSLALAQGGNLQPVQSTLQQLIQVLTGPIATSLAILAVIALGMLAWVGRLTWYFAGSIIFGIVLVFGSTQIVQFFQSAVGR